MGRLANIILPKKEMIASTLFHHQELTSWNQPLRFSSELIFIYARIST